MKVGIMTKWVIYDVISFHLRFLYKEDIFHIFPTVEIKNSASTEAHLAAMVLK